MPSHWWSGPSSTQGFFWLRGFPERWRHYEVSWSDTSVGVRPSAMPVRTAFVERGVERASLRRLVDDALAGRGGLALVAGEPGVGESRLVGEVGEEAQARGMRMLTGHCVEMSGAPPYLPYVEMIEQAINNPRSPLAMLQALGDVAAEIARIAPALRRAFPDIPPPVELPPELARRYVWNSLSEFIGRAAHDQIGSTASGRGTVCLVSWKRSSCVTCTIKLRRCSRS